MKRDFLAWSTSIPTSTDWSNSAVDAYNRALLQQCLIWAGRFITHADGDDLPLRKPGILPGQLPISLPREDNSGDSESDFQELPRLGPQPPRNNRMEHRRASDNNTITAIRNKPEDHNYSHLVLDIPDHSSLGEWALSTRLKTVQPGIQLGV